MMIRYSRIPATMRKQLTSVIPLAPINAMMLLPEEGSGGRVEGMYHIGDTEIR